jgi:hypothetical protein
VKFIVALSLTGTDTVSEFVVPLTYFEISFTAASTLLLMLLEVSPPPPPPPPPRTYYCQEKPLSPAEVAAVLSAAKRRHGAGAVTFR